VGKIFAAISALALFFLQLLKVVDKNKWSASAQVRNVKKEIARIEDEKKMWQNKRSGYLRLGLPIPDELQQRIDEFVAQLSKLERQLQAIETK